MKKKSCKNINKLNNEFFNHDQFSSDLTKLISNNPAEKQISNGNSQKYVSNPNFNSGIEEAQLINQGLQNFSNQISNIKEISSINYSRLIDTFGETENNANNNLPHYHYLNLYKIAKPFIIIYQSDASELPYQMFMPYSDCSSLHDIIKFDKDLNPRESQIEMQIFKFVGESKKSYVLKRSSHPFKSGEENKEVLQKIEKFIEKKYIEYSLIKLSNGTPHSINVCFFNVIQLKRKDFIVTEMMMEYGGKNLWQSFPFDSFKMYQLLTQMTNVLSFLEAYKIEHNDIKAGNIVESEILGFPLFKLIDFDIGINQSVTCRFDENMGITGLTKTYASPEIISFASNKSIINPWKCQVYSLGIVLLYTMQFIPYVVPMNEFDGYKLNLEKYSQIIEKIQLYALSKKDELLLKVVRIIVICIDFSPDKRLYANDLKILIENLPEKTLISINKKYFELLNGKINNNNDLSNNFLNNIFQGGLNSYNNQSFYSDEKLNDFTEVTDTEDLSNRNYYNLENNIDQIKNLENELAKTRQECSQKVQENGNLIYHVNLSRQKINELMEINLKLQEEKQNQKLRIDQLEEQISNFMNQRSIPYSKKEEAKKEEELIQINNEYFNYEAIPNNYQLNSKISNNQVIERDNEAKILKLENKIINLNNELNSLKIELENSYTFNSASNKFSLLKEKLESTIEKLSKENFTLQEYNKKISEELELKTNKNLELKRNLKMSCKECSDNKGFHSFESISELNLSSIRGINTQENYSRDYNTGFHYKENAPFIEEIERLKEENLKNKNIIKEQQDKLELYLKQFHDKDLKIGGLEKSKDEWITNFLKASNINQNSKLNNKIILGIEKIKEILLAIDFFDIEGLIRYDDLFEYIVIQYCKLFIESKCNFFRSNDSSQKLIKENSDEKILKNEIFATNFKYPLTGDKDYAIYIGPLFNGKPHGIGKLIYNNGFQYIGTFVNGIRKNVGVKYRNQDAYIGSFQNEEFNGQGIMINNFNDSDPKLYYIGKWEKNEKNGFGKLVFHKEESYQGEFKNDKKYGKGIYKWKSGLLYDGDWVNDKKQGIGKIAWPDGKIYEGEWENDLQHGKGKLITPKNEIFEGKWTKGKMNGKFKYTNTKLETIDVEFKEGKPVS